MNPIPARQRTGGRRDRLREELLRSLLEEDASAELDEPEGLGQAELAMLLRELRRGRRQPPALGRLLSSEQMQGFLWGVGAASLLMLVLPQAKESLRPLAVATVKGALNLADQVKSMLGEAGEGLQDIIAEAQFERVKEAAGPDGNGGGA